MPRIPSDLPLVERRAVRLVVVDSSDRLLLFHTRHPHFPELRTWWELPGGGIEADESYAATAVRELREETGIEVAPADVGPPIWRRVAAYRMRHVRRLQHEVVMAVRLTIPGPDIDSSRQTEYERQNYFDVRWWPLTEVLDSEKRFYPGRLPELLPTFLAGTKIAEPFELWS